MEFGLKDLLYIIGIVASGIISFLGTRHKMKEYIRDKNESITKKVHDLEIKHTELKSRDELQQQVIDQIGKQMDTLVPKLIEELNKRKKSKK
jgi:hypothetical protein